MSDKPTLSDYEPLTRSMGSRNKLPENVQSFNESLKSIADTREPDVDWVKGRPAPTVQTSNTVREVLKNGHGLSFIGLFLFSLVLYIRPYEVFPTVLWLRGIAFWIAIATILIFLPTQLGLEGKLTIRPRQVNMLLLLFLAGVFSLVLSVDRLTTWDSLNDYIKVVLMFIVFINVVRTEARLKVLLLLVLIVSCVMSVSAVNDYRLGNLAANGQRIKGIIGGMFDNPNDLALHLVTLIPVSIGLLLSSCAAFKKLFYLACAIMMCAGVVVTFSRGGFLGLICAGAVLSWRLTRQKKGLLLLLPIVLGIFIVLAPGGYGSRLATTSDGSATARTDDLKRSLYVALRHPVFGVGMGNYRQFSNKEHASHNAYTQVASELGLAAMVFYILFQTLTIKELQKIIRETPTKGRESKYHYLAVGFEAALVGYMVCSFFASVAFLWYVYYLIGYSISLNRLYRSSVLPQLHVAEVQQPVATNRSTLVTAS